jgi:NAD(P) transhydrogenase subunit alpha
VKVGVPKETIEGERRVGLVPEGVEKLRDRGLEVRVESGAGRDYYLDEAYSEAGAEIVAERSDLWRGSDLVAKVLPPTEDEIELIDEGTVVVSFLQPVQDAKTVRGLADAGATAASMDAIPRIARAQSMDALSSMSSIGGYKSVLIGANALGRYLPMMTTAAGTLKAGKVLVLGAGVAGLQAIATARRLGAEVTAFDIRPEVKEQVESLGAAFLELGVRGEETEGGYARELTPDEQRRQQEELEQRLPDFDAVITTALVPGRRAPLLIPASAVDAMRAGSVIVDLAAEAGGNCELTRPDEEVEAGGVTVVGWTNVPATMPADASRLYARNVVALLLHLAPDGELSLDWEDEIVSATCVTRRQQVSA